MKSTLSVDPSTFIPAFGPGSLELDGTTLSASVAFLANGFLTMVHQDGSVELPLPAVLSISEQTVSISS